MSGDYIKNATLNKIALREPWLAQKNEYNIIDVSLCAGQTMVPGEDNVQFAEYAECLFVFMQKLSSLFPFITFFDRHSIHSTLLTIFNDDELVFKDNKYKLINLCKKISKDFYKYSPLTIHFQDVVLTSNGSVIILGESKGLFNFRDYIYRQYETPRKLRKDIIHITLGRLLQNESIEKMHDVHMFLQNKGRLYLPSVTVNHPKIILSRDLLCLNIDANLTSEFHSSVKS